MFTYVCSVGKHSCVQVNREIAQILQKKMLSSRLAIEVFDSAEDKVVNGMYIMHTL